MIPKNKSYRQQNGKNIVSALFSNILNISVAFGQIVR